MRRFVSAALAALFVVALLGSAGCKATGTPQPSPNTPSSTVLVEEPKKYDGTGVTFTGEAIGEVMVRGDYAWLHLNDDAYYLKNVEEGAELGGYNTGMAVWLPTAEAKKATIFGDYKHEGDVVTVKGTFNAACADHGGDMDIHATSLVVNIPGRRAADPIKPWKVALAVALTLLAAGLWLAERKWGNAGDVGRRSSRR